MSYDRSAFLPVPGGRRHTALRNLFKPTKREDVLIAQAMLATESFSRMAIFVDKAYANDPVRRTSVIAGLIEDMHRKLKPIADELREEYNYGPNEWQTKLVINLFGQEGKTEDRAWWGRLLTQWWDEWRIDANRIKHGF